MAWWTQFIDLDDDDRATIRMKQGGGLKISSWKKDIVNLIDPDELIWIQDPLSWTVTGRNDRTGKTLKGEACDEGKISDGSENNHTRIQICRMICREMERLGRTKEVLVEMQVIDSTSNSPTLCVFTEPE